MVLMGEGPGQTRGGGLPVAGSWLRVVYIDCLFDCLGSFFDCKDLDSVLVCAEGREHDCGVAGSMFSKSRIVSEPNTVYCGYRS